MKQVRSTIFRFRTHAAAMAFRDVAFEPLMIVLGDHEMFWVVTPADGERLVRSGYEYAV